MFAATRAQSKRTATALRALQHAERQISLAVASLPTTAQKPNHVTTVAPAPATTTTRMCNWVATSPKGIQQVTQQALVHELTQQQVVSANKLVPWFLENMPAAYFRQVSEASRLEHLKAMSALHNTLPDSVSLKSETASGDIELTYIRQANHVGLLREIVQDLPTGIGELRRMMVYTARDASLVLNIFTFSKHPNNPFTPQTEFAHVLEYAAEVQQGKHLHDPLHVSPSPMFERDSLLDVLHRLDPKHLVSSDPRRLLKHVRAYHAVYGTDDVDVDVEEVAVEEDLVKGRQHTHWLTVAFGNVNPKHVLVGCTQILEANGLDITRSHLNLVPDPKGTVTLLRIQVGSEEGSEKMTQSNWNHVIASIKRMKWLDDVTMKLGKVDHPSLGLQRAEVITCLSSLVHGILSRESSWTFSKTNIMEMISQPRYVKHAAAISDLFVARFNPQKPLGDQEFAATKAEIAVNIAHEVEDSHANKLLLTMLEAVANIYRTNLFMENRYALGLRLNPQFLMRKDDNREVPYGVFFIHGRKFNGFHVRFRDIARGGMRLVTPNSKEQLALESTRHYDEVFNLAYAQQLKNKDIPEGGSKAVLLIDCVGTGAGAKHHIMRKSVKAFTDSLLDMIVETPSRDSVMIDRWGKPEHLYLGPDEQVLGEDISWVVNRAAFRGLPAPSTFMSSKADEGINHKEFGVTSEGVTVFLDVALRYVGIDPSKDNFTVKITGGPNGDVAGNCINILYREYGSRVRIVGLADHSGSVEDPNGLDKAELLRLFREERAIEDYDRTKLGPRGLLHTTDNDEGVRMRNTMHNRVVADAFIPAGGRPGTISISNWRQYLRKDGTPSSRVIVEGANLFITPEARVEMFKESGILICKDSSANKCGVICSSYEIIASMLLTAEEFRALKPVFVPEVITKLRSLARLEAELLFNEYHNFPGALPFFSERISKCINRLKDKIREALAQYKTVEELEPFLPIFHSHLPPSLLKVAQDRIPTNVPLQYIRNAIASTLASRMAYNEGTMYIDTLPTDRVAEIAFKYHRAEQEVATLVELIKNKQLDDEQLQKILDIVKNGGVRTRLTGMLKR